MASVSLASVVRYCDRLMQTRRFTDWEGAFNGLQVENCGAVTRIAAAVDARRATVQMAIAARADLLLVHHGLFWGPSQPWVGQRYRLLRLLLDHNLAIYSSHLPLDAHPRLGNNARLCAALGLQHLKPFFVEKGRYLGYQATVRVSREELAKRLTVVVGRAPLMLPGGPKACRSVGVVSGGAGSELRKAVAEGVDTLITGEGPHWTHALAEELGLNVLYAGHYATETFGVKALAEHLSKRFRVPWTFLDYPTGL